MLIDVLDSIEDPEFNYLSDFNLFKSILCTKAHSYPYVEGRFRLCLFKILDVSRTV